MPISKEKMLDTVREYFKTFPHESFESFILDTKEVYEYIQSEQIEPYHPIDVKPINQQTSGYGMNVDQNKTEQINDADLSNTDNSN